ncbi:LysR family transcriptional regulator [Pontivivens ytuae]|uniref:LysR family transcriptional regulator n=1 Tax=Pontivivens ytuae TaxID=2789856 RepID=A0A7S9QDX8_9RHOB|nr:LysR family transcriptional regulator [Pontivivens ytuae]QPH54621.1 LysR family transcriptional regulator [Pontivivens ytuae]
MHLKSLTAFCFVLRRGSLSAAADAMNLSQPAVSRLISNLEHEVGFALFHRDKRTLRPTGEGRRFHREAERILTGIEQLGNIAKDIKQGGDARLRVVVMSRLAGGALPDAAAAFRAQMPDVDLTVETHHRRDMERWLGGRQFDVGFGPLPVAGDQLDIQPLGTLNAVSVFAPGGPFAGQKVVEPRALAEHPLIALTPDTLLQSQTEAIFAAAGIVPRTGMSTSSSQVACMLAARGLGYAITDPVTARAVPEALEVIPIAPAFPLEYGVLTPRGVTLTPAATVFRDCMAAVFDTLRVA